MRAWSVHSENPEVSSFSEDLASTNLLTSRWKRCSNEFLKSQRSYRSMNIKKRSVIISEHMRSCEHGHGCSGESQIRDKFFVSRECCRQMRFGGTLPMALLVFPLVLFPRSDSLPTKPPNLLYQVHVARIFICLNRKYCFRNNCCS